MRAGIAFATVVLVWSTTPLGIQWSLQGVGPLFALALRMVLGSLFCVAVLLLLKVRLPLNRRAMATYGISGLGMVTAMAATYWGAQFISSGWVSVVYGATPLWVGLTAALWLGERFGPAQGAGSLLGLAGLGLIFGHGAGALGVQAVLGVGSVTLGVAAYAVSIVWVKRLGTHLHPLALTAGTMGVAAPLFLLLWLWQGAPPPAEIPLRAAAAILYLALMGSVVGVVAFFEALTRLPAGKVALITLLAPLIALWLGSALNDEVLDPGFLEGAGLVLLGLAVHQYGDGAWRRVARGYS